MQQRSNRRLFLFSLLLSVLFLGICSRSSPLYVMNSWEDVHCFFTLGRSVTDGLVLYRDIYDQKGPLLYFLFALASLISRDTFLGVFLLEVLTYTAFLYFSATCAQLHLGKRTVIYAVLALLAPIVMVGQAFADGSSAEQYCLWIFPCSFYFIDRAIREERRLMPKEAFIIGLCAGYALYIKFTILGFFLGLALFILIWYLFFDKSPKELPAIIGAFLLGILAVSLPIFLYFVINGAVSDFLTGYFYNNLFLYQGESATFKERLVSYYVYMKSTAINNPEFVFIDILGGLWLFLTPKKHYKFFTSFLFGILFLSIATLGGGRFYPYYTLTFAGFAVYGLIALVHFLRKAAAFLHFTPKFSNKLPAVGIVILTAALMVYSYFVSPNTYFMAYTEDDLPQYRFAEYIGQKEDPSLLYYGFLDGGFYFTTGITPPCKYIGWLNIPLDDIGPTQRKLIEEGAVDFVVTRTFELDSDLYQLVTQGQMPPGGEEPEVYFLYERIEP